MSSASKLAPSKKPAVVVRVAYALKTAGADQLVTATGDALQAKS